MTEIGNNVLVVVPTYNESNNIEKLISEIDRVAHGNFDVLFVDDNSPDGTGRLIDKICSERKNVFVIHRHSKMGLGSAYLEGFRYGLDKGYTYIFEMDADLSHNPECLKPMLDKLQQFDVVVGSRFKGEPSNINSTPFRILTSLAAVLYMQWILGLKCSDPMAGFVGYRREVLARLDYSNFLTSGYAFQAEVKYECQRNGFSMTDLPIIFKKRRIGDSKISIKDVVEALVIPWKIRFKR